MRLFFLQIGLHVMCISWTVGWPCFVCHVHDLDSGGVMFCMSNSKSVVFLMIYETKSDHVLYVTYKTCTPGYDRHAGDVQIANPSP